MLDFGFYNMDCMEGMKQFPDKYFDLAIVDPPYGIGIGGVIGGGCAEPLPNICLFVGWYEARRHEEQRASHSSYTEACGFIQMAFTVLRKAR